MAMNSIKKAIFTLPLDKRRSSLPIIDSSIVDSIKRIKHSSPLIEPSDSGALKQRSGLLNDEKLCPENFNSFNNSCVLSPVVCPSSPQFVIPTVLFGDQEHLLVTSPLQGEVTYPRTSSPLLSQSGTSLKKANHSSNFTRRASCGPTFPQIKTPSYLTPIKCSAQLSLNIRNGSSFISDNSPPSKENSSEDKSFSKNVSFLAYPSLSPCLEDKPKLSTADRRHSHFFTFIESTNSEELFNGKDRLLNKRRASFHTPTTSPRYPHAGVFCALPSSKRRKSFCNSAISRLIYEVDNQNSANENDSNHFIGKGGFGVVKVGNWKGERVAVKTLEGSKAKSSIEYEKNTLFLGKHPSIVQTYALVLSGSSDEVTVLTKKERNNLSKFRMTQFYGLQAPMAKECMIISELCSSINLLKIINSCTLLSDEEIFKILQQIVSALSYLHSLGFVHLDVKPANCFFTQNGYLKLGDFGCLSHVNELPKKFLGTVAYQAPEVMKGEVITEKCDIFSFAITACHLLNGEAPYLGMDQHLVIYKVVRLDYRPSFNVFPNQSLHKKVLKSVITKSWAKNIEDRPSSNSLCRTLASLLYSSKAKDVFICS